MRWLNNYHRGFNRVWLVVSIIGGVAGVGLRALTGGYTAQYPEYSGADPYDIDPHYWEQYSRKHSRTMTTKEGRKYSIMPPDYRYDSEFVARRAIIVRVVYLIRNSAADELDNERILENVRLMKESKFFTTDNIKALIDYKVAEQHENLAEEQKRERIYQKKKWMALGRFVRDLLGVVIVTFAAGHGVFLVVWWIIRGFRGAV